MPNAVSQAPLPPGLHPGRLVHVRTRRYLVEEVTPGPSLEDATVVRLSCVDDDNQGKELTVLWEYEVDAKLLGEESWRNLGNKGFDKAEVFSAYYHTLKWNCVSAADPRIFHAPFRAGIQIHAYQLEPLRKALLLPRVNLFIADDVGLGKTIEAGLIIREMLLRKKAHTLIVACPASVLLQWQEEMELRFGLGFEIMDRAYLGRIRQERGYAVNPWSTHSRFIVSHALLRDEAYLSTLRDHLGGMCAQSMLILDEAHHAAPASGSKYAIDSQFTRAIRDLAGRFEHRLFLSATPHNGHSNSFSSLLELLDPQRFCRGVKPAKEAMDQVLIRRLKEDLRTLEGGFPKREVLAIELDESAAQAPELEVARLLAEYGQALERRMESAGKRQRAAQALVLSHLQQRLFSSLAAFSRTLGVHLRTLENQGLLPRGLGGRPQDDTFALNGAGAVLAAEDAAEPEKEEFELALDTEADTVQDPDELSLQSLAKASHRLKTPEARSLPPEEVQLLRQMQDVSERHKDEVDARLKHLLTWMRDHLCPAIKVPGEARREGADPSWTPVRVVLFTEYTDTLRWVKACLEEALVDTDNASRRIEIFTGETDRKSREVIKRAFNSDPATHPLRILLANDAAREGVNLQNHCNQLFHLDLPWNPSRLEQRNGRIDRKLQRAPKVYCHYFVYRHRPEDRVLQALVRKTETIRKDLGSLSRVLEGRLAQMAAGGIRRKEVDSLTQAIETAEAGEARKVTEEELEASRESARKLQEQIKRAQDHLRRSQQEIGFEEEAFRQALDQSLMLYQAQPLTPVELPGGEKAYAFPRLDEQAGADPSWAATLDSLRPPRQEGQAFGVRPGHAPEDGAPRPVLFRDSGNLDESAVHLHLEHRVVQRLLGRFSAQGFLHHDLSRACLAHSEDAIPRVALLGRLCLYGPGSVRLHEELLAVTARWSPPEPERKPLRPQGERAEEETLRLLEASLRRPGEAGIPEAIRRKLAASMRRDVEELHDPLVARGEERAREAEARLAERGRKEAESMRKLLEMQKAGIEKALAGYGTLQMDMFAPEERRQRESEHRHQLKRLEELAREIGTEPRRIEESYRVKVPRLEPIGLVYLYPVTG